MNVYIHYFFFSLPAKNLNLHSDSLKVLSSWDFSTILNVFIYEIGL